MKNNKTLAFLALAFVALFSYWTFNQIQFYLNKDKNKSFENLPDTSSSSTQNLGDNNADTTATISNNKVVDVGTWVATDYKQGDISKGNYTVKSGDTLWEIAEAVYGDGTQWVNILNANSASVDYLPNGQQALIFPGQVLVIP
ncbi:MAG: LysM peptidoglycan-binding domain-containing protein [Patescibacteria group bacterium]